MSTKSIYVHNDWIELTKQIATERALLWRIAVSVPATALVMTLMLRALPLPAVVTTVLIQAVSFCFFYAVAVWYVLRHQPGGVKAVLGIYLGSLSISVIAGSLALGPLGSPFQFNSHLSWTGLVGIALFPFNWLLLRATAYEHPQQFETLGLTLPTSQRHMVYGLLGGCLLAAHFFFTGVLAELFTLTWKPWPFALYQLSLALGLRSLSEELFFRGLIFQQLYRIRQGGFWTASAVATLGNVVTYIGIRWQGDPNVLIITLFYVAAVAVVNALLYRVSDSIAPGVISSVIFHFLTSLH